MMVQQYRVCRSAPFPECGPGWRCVGYALGSVLTSCDPLVGFCTSHVVIREAAHPRQGKCTPRRLAGPRQRVRLVTGQSFPCGNDLHGGFIRCAMGSIVPACPRELKARSHMCAKKGIRTAMPRGHRFLVRKPSAPIAAAPFPVRVCSESKRLKIDEDSLWGIHAGPASGIGARQTCSHRRKRGADETKPTRHISSS